MRYGLPDIGVSAAKLDRAAGQVANDGNLAGGQLGFELAPQFPAHEIEVAWPADEKRVFQLMTSFRQIPRRLEDRFIESTVADGLAELYRSVGYADEHLQKLPFRAISARKCQRIFYIDHERSPYVYVQRMNTDPNVHISVAGDTLHFNDFIERWLSTPEKRTELLAGLGRSELIPIPDPPV